MRGIEKKIADEFGIPKEEVHKIVSSSYEYIKSLLKNDSTSYEITGLGTLNFLPNMAKKKLVELEKREDFLETKEEIINSINSKLEKYLEK